MNGPWVRERYVAAGVAISLVLIGASPALAEELVGRATVVDADTIDIRGKKIRLLGIDAPESAQRCTQTNGTEWRCGQRAANSLADKIGHRNVRCVGDKHGRWKRLIAVCFLGGLDLNAWLVESGWAVAYRAYSRDYVQQENAARSSKLGVWSGTFAMPWDWRQERRAKD